MPAIPEYTPEEESKDTRSFRVVTIGGEERRISLKLIEQYRPIVQHGGKSLREGGRERQRMIYYVYMYILHMLAYCTSRMKFLSRFRSIKFFVDHGL